MAFSVSNLINNIKNSIDSLAQDLGDNSSANGVPKAPNSKDILKDLSYLNQSNWMKLSFPYTFSVIDISNGSSPNPFTDFSLPIAPSSLTQTEEPSISITSTQGGTVVNHSGNKYKMLNIAGTTGIAPFSSSGGADRKTGEAIFQPKQLKYKSGYEVFIRLRNWLRAYYSYKKSQGKDARNLRLLFKNYKDGEFSIVELLKFDMERQAARSFLYDYKIEFKVIGLYSFKAQDTNTNYDFEAVIDSSLNKINNARGIFLRSQNILRQIEGTYNSVVLEPLRTTTLAIKALRGIPLVAADLGSRVLKNTLSEADTLAIALGILNDQKQNRTSGALDTRVANINLPNDLESAVSNQKTSLIDSFGEGLMALDSGIFPEKTNNAAIEEQNLASELPASYYSDLINNLERIKSNAEDSFNLGSDFYDSLFNRTSTVSTEETKVATIEEFDLLFGLNEAIIGLKMLLSTEELFKSSLDDQIQDMIDRFDGNIQLFSTSAVQQITYSRGLTLEKISQDYLGDSNRWGEIVEINNLKPPYVVQSKNTGYENVVAPGDVLLLPAPLTSGFANISEGPGNKLTKDMSVLEKSLGVDLKLTDEFDLSLTSSNDFELIAGSDNLAQGVILKLHYEPGEVIRYPDLGAGLIIGSKVPELNELKDLISNSLMQDGRVDRVDNLQLVRDNNTISLNFNIKIKNVDIPVPVTIKI